MRGKPRQAIEDAGPVLGVIERELGSLCQPITQGWEFYQRRGDNRIECFGFAGLATEGECVGPRRQTDTNWQPVAAKLASVDLLPDDRVADPETGCDAISDGR